MAIRENWRKKTFNRFAEHGVWLGFANGASCPLLVVDDVDDDSPFRTAVQLEDWDGRPGISSRLFDSDQDLCEAIWLGNAVIHLSGPLASAAPRSLVGSIYLRNHQPVLFALDDTGRVRDHTLVGATVIGGHGDGYYDWALFYSGCHTCVWELPVFRSDQIDSWINQWTPPAHPIE